VDAHLVRRRCGAVRILTDTMKGMKQAGLRNRNLLLNRRAWLGGAGFVGLTGVSTYLYKAAPALWQQMAREALRPIFPAPFRPQPQRWPDKGLYATWLGHSTVLLRLDGFTILTDPIFSNRAGLNLGPLTLGLKRLVAPALGM